MALLSSTLSGSQTQGAATTLLTLTGILCLQKLLLSQTWIINIPIAYLMWLKLVLEVPLGKEANIKTMGKMQISPLLTERIKANL